MLSAMGAYFLAVLIWMPFNFVQFLTEAEWGPGYWQRLMRRIDPEKGGSVHILLFMPFLWLTFPKVLSGTRCGMCLASVELLVALDNYFNGTNGKRRKGKKSAASEIKSWVLEAIERTKNWKPVAQPTA